MGYIQRIWPVVQNIITIEIIIKEIAWEQMKENPRLPMLVKALFIYAWWCVDCNVRVT